MPGPHAQVSPSAAYRWISCPGSVAMSKGLPDDEGTVYAMEGTIAHHMAELILTGQKPEPDDAETEFLYNNKIDLDELLKMSAIIPIISADLLKARAWICSLNSAWTLNQ